MPVNKIPKKVKYLGSGIIVMVQLSFLWAMWSKTLSAYVEEGLKISPGETVAAFLLFSCGLIVSLIGGSFIYHGFVRVAFLDDERKDEYNEISWKTLNRRKRRMYYFRELCIETYKGLLILITGLFLTALIGVII